MAPLAEQLAGLVSADRVSRRRPDLAAAAGDESSQPATRPDLVVWPLSAEEISGVIHCAASSGTAVTARGAGSSLEGNPIPVRGGIVLDLSRMNRVAEVRPGDLQVDVEPGVVYADLNEQLRPHGLFFPPAPGGSSDVATIGGMVANNASGIYSAKYGSTRDYVRAATVVTGTGEIVILGNRCRKHSSGYDLLDLVVGSEGTLAVVAAVTLALAGRPAAVCRQAVAFADDAAAAAAIADLLRYGVDLAAAEFLDRHTMAAINAFRGLSLAEAPTLLTEVHGTESTLEKTAAAVAAITAEHGARPVPAVVAGDPWRELRRYATRAVQARDPDADIVRADLAVPIAALPDLVEACAKAGERHGLRVFLFGHAGVGILHVLAPVRRGREGECESAETAKDELVEAALKLGGAVSGEHGMGLGNRRYAARAFGPALDLMKAVKAVFDPQGILNPGKIWLS